MHGKACVSSRSSCLALSSKEICEKNIASEGALPELPEHRVHQHCLCPCNLTLEALWVFVKNLAQSSAPFVTVDFRSFHLPRRCAASCERWSRALSVDTPECRIWKSTSVIPRLVLRNSRRKWCHVNGPAGRRTSIASMARSHAATTSPEARWRLSPPSRLHMSLGRKHPLSTTPIISDFAPTRVGTREVLLQPTCTKGATVSIYQELLSEIHSGSAERTGCHECQCEKIEGPETQPRNKATCRPAHFPFQQQLVIKEQSARSMSSPSTSGRSWLSVHLIMCAQPRGSFLQLGPARCAPPVNTGVSFRSSCADLSVHLRTLCRARRAWSVRHV